jgi:hypothetical protein
MAHSHQKHRQQRHSTKRAHQFLSENGVGHGAHKRHGGAVSDPAKQVDIKRGSAEHSNTYVEGVRNSHRIPRKRGGKIPQINVTIHKHAPPLMMGAAMPPQAPGMPAPPMGAAPTMGAPPMNQGGPAGSYGAASGMSRLAEYERLRRGH